MTHILRFHTEIGKMPFVLDPCPWPRLVCPWPWPRLVCPWPWPRLVCPWPWPRKKFKVLGRTTTLLPTCSYHNTPFTFAILSNVSSQPSISIYSSLFFLSTNFTPHIDLTMALSVLLEIAISISLKHHLYYILFGNDEGIHQLDSSDPILDLAPIRNLDSERDVGTIKY